MSRLTPLAYHDDSPPDQARHAAADYARALHAHPEKQRLFLELDIPMDRIVRMVLAMVDGWVLWLLLEPDEVDDALLEEMTGIFTTGIDVLSGALERT